MARNQTINFDDGMAVVNQLASELKDHKHGLHVAEVLKAGSLGQYTAVPGNYDVDLVIYSDSVDKNTVLAEGYKQPLHKIRSFLGGLRRVELSPPLKMSVSLKYKAYNYQSQQEQIIDVDILVSPNWSDRRDFYEFLRRAKANGAKPEQLFRFSVNASKWQVKFMQNQSDEVQELIRRAKAWRNKKWPDGRWCRGRPKSYLISILVLKAYETAKEKSSEIIALRTTVNLKQIVKNHRQADIHWKDFYNLADYCPDLIPDYLPRIIDPANPANNLHTTGIIGGDTYSSHSYYEQGDGNWTVLVEKIDSIDLTKTVPQIQAGS